jgi:predicted ArsR family transcriptional regulator
VNGDAPSTSAAAGAGVTGFTSALTAITSAFGDPTRRAIYLHLREHAGPDSDGITTTQVAEQFGLHPNVARHHLDKLAAGGYLAIVTSRQAGAGAGRPSKRYHAIEDGVTGEFPVRSDDLVLSLLGRSLAMLPPGAAEAMAEQVGHEYGVAMAAGLIGHDGDGSSLAAGQRSLRSAMQAVADALSAHGFAAHTEKRNDQLRIVSQHCPFGDVAIEHPVICAVDRGMVKGMLTALYGGDVELSLDASLPQGDGFCATSV